jgi:hypothetical protein
MPIPAGNRRDDANSPGMRLLREVRTSGLLSASSVGYFLLFILFAFASIQICLVGLSSAGQQVVLNQIARTRVIAEIPFTYVSEIETARVREEIGKRTPPVYMLNQEPVRQFRDWVMGMQDALDKYLASPNMGGLQTAAGPQMGLLKVAPEEMDEFLATLPGGNRYNLNGEDLSALANTLGAQARRQAFEEGLRILSDIQRQGVFDPSQTPVASSGGLSFIKIEDEYGAMQEAEILSEEQAISDLKINLGTVEMPRESFIALFRILRIGVKPNLVFDQNRTGELVQQAISRIEPRKTSIHAGATIIEPGTRVTDLQFEQLQAYRQARRENADKLGPDAQFFDRAILAVATVVALAIFLRLSKRKLGRRVLALAGMTTLLNLGLIRIIVSMGESSIGQTMPTVALILLWAAPVSLGPILMSMMMGTGAGALTAALVAVFNGMMQGGSMAVFMVTLLTGLAAVHACRNVQVRTRVFRAGIAAGLMMACFAVVMALRDESSGPLVTTAMVLASVVNGFLCGVVAVGLMPVFERLFRHTTDITLLELTDFNHPLLRKLQVAAPGSYHHSLMVANLAENAAMQIGANPLVCRVAALYHDIGKILKPDYYIENQREGNPHMDRNPSMSALIIKAHVKEGLALAKQYRMPKIVLDNICQHHGTTLIQYFYQLAIQKQKQQAEASGVSLSELEEVSPSTYRYEGPRPQTAESAIVMFSDTLEAASRSLKKVTAVSIEEFVDGIVQGRIDDGQMDEAPLTMRQITLLRKSFTFTLINMLHSRIEYPKGEPQKKAGRVQAPVSTDDRAGENTGVKNGQADE